MTTIAVSKTQIAYDSQMTAGSMKHVCAFEKVQTHKGKVYAFCGQADMFRALIKWEQKGAPTRKKLVPPGDWELLVITPKGMIHYTPANKYGCALIAPVCMGSGGDIARGALEVGATALEAVKAAARVDCYTGYDIKVLETAELLKVKRKKRKWGRR